jgi:hypothetical protein
MGSMSWRWRPGPSSRFKIERVVAIETFADLPGRPELDFVQEVPENSASSQMCGPRSAGKRATLRSGRYSAFPFAPPGDHSRMVATHS